MPITSWGRRKASWRSPRRSCTSPPRRNRTASTRRSGRPWRPPAHPTEPVPLHIRNAPTKLMEELGYGAGYEYAHAFEHAYVPQEYLPEVLRGASWYQPTAAGYEKTIGERMEFWKQLRDRIERETGKGKRET